MRYQEKSFIVIVIVSTPPSKYIRARIAETVGITASAGVAPNKFLAKIAGDGSTTQRATTMGVRLLGVGVRLAETENTAQLPLFDVEFGS
jgi:nucleotidyltransferase/DNA polymerase involved in DNA repair